MSSLLQTLSSTCRDIMKPHFIPTIMLVILSLVVVPYSFYVTSQKRLLLMNKITTNNTGFRAHKVSTYRLLSAFHEKITGETREIKILGFHHLSENLPVYCKLLAPDGTSYCLGNPALETPILNYEGKYSADHEVIVTCTYKNYAEIIGVSLSFSQTCENDGPVIQVEYPAKQKASKNSDVRLCILGFPRVEFTNETLKRLQLWKAYGIDYMDIYTSPIKATDDTSKQVFEVLEDTYELRHHIWSPGERALHKYGYTLAMNDCFYRYRYVSKYIIFSEVLYFLFLQNNEQFSEFLPKTRHAISSPFIFDSFSMENFTLNVTCQNMSAEQTTVDVITKLSKNTANIIYPTETKTPIALPDEFIGDVFRVNPRQAAFLKFTPSYFRGENKTIEFQGKQFQRMCSYLNDH